MDAAAAAIADFYVLFLFAVAIAYAAFGVFFDAYYGYAADIAAPR